MRKMLLGVMACALIAQPVVAAPTKSWGYKPFVVTSQKLGKEMSDAYIMENLMCKPTTGNLAEYMELIRNYDLLRTNPMDGSMSFTYFGGRQEGREVAVSFVVDTSNQVLSYVWVDGVPHLHCL